MADSENTTIPSRRAILTGIPTAAIGVGSLASMGGGAAAAKPDPIYAAIERHAVATRRGKALMQSDNESDELFDAIGEEGCGAWAALMVARPTTGDGLLAYISYLASYDDLENLINDHGPYAYLPNIAASLRQLLS